MIRALPESNINYEVESRKQVMSQEIDLPYWFYATWDLQEEIENVSQQMDPRLGYRRLITASTSDGEYR